MLHHVSSAAVEFRRVIDAISASQAPVIGHNCFLDFIHTTSKFVGDPPANVTDWAVQLSSVYPVVFDTKVRDVLRETRSVLLFSSSAPCCLAACTSHSSHLHFSAGIVRCQ
jgi:hypothetical protein